MNDAAKAICFVDIPFGKKVDPKSGIEIDFDQVFEKAIEPAIVRAKLSAIRGDRENTGGIIHTAMFARLLLTEFVIADMTTANPNVFYELGVRHTARPYTTIPVFATIGAPPFDVNMVRAIPYDLTDGELGDEAAAALIDTLVARIERAVKGPVVEDSPLFALFPNFPGIEMSHELTDVFRDRVDYSNTLKNELVAARAQSPQENAKLAIDKIAERQGDRATVERGVLIDIYLSYRAIEAFDRMIELYETMPVPVKASALARQQLGFAFNRRNEPDDRDRAIAELNRLLDEQGDSAETLGVLERVYKDKYIDAKKAGDPSVGGWLDRAIEAYTRGFEAEPADYYPGVNAINLSLQKGDEKALEEVDRLTPLVTFAAVRRGGEKADDYWTVATVLELACAGHDYELAKRCTSRALTFDNEAWMFETTTGNLRLIESLRGTRMGSRRLRL